MYSRVMRSVEIVCGESVRFVCVDVDVVCECQWISTLLSCTFDAMVVVALKRINVCSFSVHKHTHTNANKKMAHNRSSKLVRIRVSFECNTHCLSMKFVWLEIPTAASH